MKTQQGLYKVQKLTEGEQEAVMQLAALCDQRDGLTTRLDREMLRDRDGEKVYDYLYYDNELLIGYLGMSSWGLEEKELVGLVHPDYRRRGVARSLLAAASQEARLWGTKRFDLICEHASSAGQAFIQAVGAAYNFAEHEMWLQNFQPRFAFDDRLVFRAATLDDVDALAAVLLTEYENDEGVARERVKKLFQRPLQRLYLATLGGEELGCHEPVGTLRLDDHEDFVGIYGFVVKPDYRGRGYGRQMLEEAIRTIQAEGQKKIMLDVDVTNANALGLYLSLGFVIKTTYDYYTLEL